MNTTTKVGGAAGATLAVIIAAAAFIQPWEGRELRAYRDIVGVLTICDGDTHNVRPGQVATNAECDQRLYANLKVFDAELHKCLVVPLPAKTHMAMLSWVYNVGYGAACHGGKDGRPSQVVLKANAGDLAGACRALMDWTKAGGVVRQGLVNRRDAERQLCLAGVAGV